MSVSKDGGSATAGATFPSLLTVDIEIGKFGGGLTDASDNRSPVHHFVFVKIDFAIIMCTPLFPSTTCVMCRSAATLANI